MQPSQQTYLDFNLAPGDFVTVKQIAAACGFCEQHVLNAFETGKVLGFEANGRAERGKESRWAKRIPRRFALLYLASIANFNDEDLIANFGQCIAGLPKPLAMRVQQLCAERLKKWD